MRVITDSNILFEFTSIDKERKQFTHQQAHTHRNYTCLMLRSVFMLGHADWVLQVLFTLACMAQHYAMNKRWWVGFKEPYLLFQHQKVHLGASVIFHLFPQLRLGCIMMRNSLSLFLSSTFTSLLSSPLPSSPISLSLSWLLHMLHWSFVALIISLDFYKKNTISLNSACS